MLQQVPPKTASARCLVRTCGLDTSAHHHHMHQHRSSRSPVPEQKLMQIPHRLETFCLGNIILGICILTQNSSRSAPTPDGRRDQQRKSGSRDGHHAFCDHWGGTAARYGVEGERLKGDEKGAERRADCSEVDNSEMACDFPFDRLID